MNYLELRKKKNMTQGEVAKKVGISVQAYQLIERGNTKNPRAETMKALKEILA
jgi:transcriptional regulator with XRE-family HTH domain